MSRGKGALPPKKKHENRPRPEPVVRLTDGERRTRAAQEFAKAQMHLVEAERLANWGQAPNACIHSAYYAMHHCASAAILLAGGVGKRGDVPRSHEHVIEHFGNLVEQEAGMLGQCGRMLSQARSERMMADYDLVRSATPSEASDTVADAQKFLAACRARWPL
jgi:uncharacterized protein (UPF0332 family)